MHHYTYCVYRNGANKIPPGVYHIDRTCLASLVFPAVSYISSFPCNVFPALARLVLARTDVSISAETSALE